MERRVGWSNDWRCRWNNETKFRMEVVEREFFNQSVVALVFVEELLYCML